MYVHRLELLILSCGTGGGHNEAGNAIREELEQRGHRVTMMNPYELKDHKTAETVNQMYIRIDPYGIPVWKAFREQKSKADAIEKLGLDSDKQYILVSGGDKGSAKYD